MPDPLTLSIVTGIAVSACFTGGSFFIAVSDKIAVWFRRLTDFFYYHIDVPVGNQALFISLTRWMQSHMHKNQKLKKLFVSLNNGAQGSAEQMALPAVDECLEVQLHKQSRVWIRTLSQCEQKTVSVEGFRIYIASEHVNRFIYMVLEVAGIVDNTALKGFRTQFLESVSVPTGTTYENEMMLTAYKQM